MQTDEWLRQFAGYDEDELLAELGAWRLGETLGIRPGDFGRYARLGRRWLDEHAGELRALLCGHEKVIAVRAVVQRDEAVELATVADVLVQAYGQLPAALVALIVVRRGLDRLCA